jgi:hypothetical protein
VNFASHAVPFAEPPGAELLLSTTEHTAGTLAPAEAVLLRMLAPDAG